jgi:hypothetical protein
MDRPPRLWRIGAASIIIGGVASFGGSAAIGQTVGGGSNPNTYTVSVQSDGVSISLQDDKLPVTQTVSTSPYSALATLDSIGDSTAQAGAPYLGSVVEPLLGTVNGLGAGKTPTLPPLPGYVASNYPTTPTATQSNGPYSITASSSQNESTSAVNLGVAQPGSQSTTVSSRAHADATSDGSVTASGSAGADLLNIGGILDVANVSSTVTMIEQGSAPPKISTHTNLGTTTVIGIPIGINQDGLTVLGSNVPLPTNVLSQAVNQALTAAGMSISYLPATTTKVPGTDTVQSIDSGAVKVSFVRNVPTQGPVTVDLILGHVKLSVINTAAQQPPDSSVPSGGISGGTGSSSPSGDNLSGPQAAASPNSAVSSATSGSPAPIAASQPTSGVPSAAPPAVAPNPGRSRQSPTGQASPAFQVATTERGTEGAYLFLVLAGVAALLGSQVIRILGVRLRAT